MRSPDRYTRVAIALHWLIAAAILSNLALGSVMTDLPLSPQKLRIYAYHKWTGISVALLVLARIAWRLGHRPPPLPPSMPRWERSAAQVSHFALYALTLAVPLSGWLFSSAKGFQTVYLGLVPIPDLLAQDATLADALLLWHRGLNYLMVALLGLHVAAALKHHFRDRDDVLVRMLPFHRRSNGTAR
jgi:cytochrome b561